MGTLVDLARAYPGPATLASIANTVIAIALRSAFPRRVLRQPVRVVAYLLAGLFGGLVAVAETLLAIEMLDFRQEAAGLALLFLPLLLAPTTVATLAWLFGDAVSGRSKRPAWALVGAIAGALTMTSLLVSVFERPLVRALVESMPQTLSPFTAWSLLGVWSLLGLPIAAGAAVGHTVARGRV